MDEAETKSRSTGFLWAAAGPVLLLVYVLSVGPVARVCQNFSYNGPALRSFYYPLILLHENTPFRKPLDAYIKLWGVH